MITIAHTQGQLAQAQSRLAQAPPQANSTPEEVTLRAQHNVSYQNARAFIEKRKTQDFIIEFLAHYYFI
jgi:hypothetical protein